MDVSNLHPNLIHGFYALDPENPIPQREPRMLTPEEFCDAMKAIAERQDLEECHIAADDLMTSLLAQLGYGKGVDIFDDMPKYYV